MVFTMSHKDMKMPAPKQYITSEPRREGEFIKAYFTKGEYKLILAAMDQVQRVPNQTDFVATAALEKACDILGYEFPLPRPKK